MITDKAAGYAETLELAADVLKSGQLGWTQGRLHDATSVHRYSPPITQVCGFGAILVSLHLQENRNAIATEIRTCDLGLHLPIGLGALLIDALKGTFSRWNDDSSRTKEDVIDFFESTAKKLRNGEITP